VMLINHCNAFVNFRDKQKPLSPLRINQIKDTHHDMNRELGIPPLVRPTIVLPKERSHTLCFIDLPVRLMLFRKLCWLHC
jgi:hypothetical protein